MMALENAMTTRGGCEVLGQHVDLGKIDVDAYIVAGINDHIVDWRNAYRRRSCSAARPVRALHERPHPGADQPAGPESRSSYRVARRCPKTSNQAFVDDTPTVSGSWWPDSHAEWLKGAFGPDEDGPARRWATPSESRPIAEGARQLRARVLRNLERGGEGDPLAETRWALERPLAACSPTPSPTAAGCREAMAGRCWCCRASWRGG